MLAAATNWTMLARVCVAIVVILWLVPADSVRAANWVEVAADDQTVHFVDESSMRRDGEVVRVAKRAVYRDPQPIGELLGTPRIRESVGVVEDDCQRFQHRAVSIQLISVDDKVIWSSGEMKRVWETVEPGSPGRATLDWVCTRSGQQ